MERVFAVFAIDGDPKVRATIEEWVLAMNIECRTFALGEDFLAACTESVRGCLVLGTRIPDMNALDIERRLRGRGITLPTMFLSEDHDRSLAKELMRGGAVRCLRKPIRPLELVNAVHEALTVDQSRRSVSEQE